MYEWYKTNIEQLEHEPKPPIREGDEQNTSKLVRTIKHPGFIIIYGLIATFLIAVAVTNYNSFSRLDFMGTRLRLVSIDGGRITMVDPSGEFMIMETFGGSQATVHYQDATFSLMHGTSDSPGLHFTFSDGETVMVPTFRAGTYQNPSLFANQTERQQAEGDLLRAVGRLRRSFVPTSTIIFYVMVGLAMSFVGSFIMSFSWLHFPKKPPSEWSGVFNALTSAHGGIVSGVVLILWAFAIVARM